MKKAKILEKSNKILLKAGKKGTGKILHSVRVWDSFESLQGANRVLKYFAQKNGYEIC